MRIGTGVSPKRLPPIKSTKIIDTAKRGPGERPNDMRLGLLIDVDDSTKDGFKG